MRILDSICVLLSHSKDREGNQGQIYAEKGLMFGHLRYCKDQVASSRISMGGQNSAKKVSAQLKNSQSLLNSYVCVSLPHCIPSTHSKSDNNVYYKEKTSKTRVSKQPTAPQ